MARIGFSLGLAIGRIFSTYLPPAWSWFSSVDGEALTSPVDGEPLGLYLISPVTPKYLRSPVDGRYLRSANP